ncbi:MAG: M67 family metallopeptidase [Nitrospirota bacterium]
MKLQRHIIEQIQKHALDEYPFECCGIVTGGSDNQTIHLCRNIQNSLHAEDPDRYPRDARIAYMIDRSEFDRIVSDARGKGEVVLAFYHSHPEHGAFFSEEDHAAQTVFGEPEYPEALHVVVSVINRTINSVRCFKWDGASRSFRPADC